MSPASIPPIAYLERAVMNMPAQQTLRKGPFDPAQIRGYLFAIAAFIVSFALRWWLEGSLPPGFPFLTFFPAVMLVSFVFGRYAGLLIALLSSIACWFIFLPGTPISKLLPVGFFLAIIAIDIGIINLMHQALHRMNQLHQRARVLAEERSLLIREIHHRVGNSLALVTSLLRIHRSNNIGEDAAAVLKDAEARVLAISKVQANLYAKNQVTDVDLSTYLQALVEDLKGSIEDGGVRVIVEAEPLSIDHDRAIALGLIAIELMLNAKKHAFPDGKGLIMLTLRASEDGLNRLTVADDGVGRQEFKASTTSTGVGSKIISAMAGKLAAQITTDDAPTGASTTIAFPDELPIITAQPA